MKKKLQRRSIKGQFRWVFSAMLFGLLFCVSLRGNAQIYYVTSDGTGASSSAADALVKINYDGSGSTTPSSSFTHSPGYMALDLPNNRAFVAELFDAQKAIKVINLSTGAVTTTINISAPIVALKYDPVGGYIYYLTNDGVTGTANSTDALGRVKPDGTSNTTLISSLSKDPLFMASDFANNKVYVFERLFSDHAFLTLTISGSSASVTTNTFITTDMLPTGSIINGMDYDPTTNFIYYLTSNNAAGIGATDGISKVHPDGTGNAVIVSSLTNNPFLFALDVGNNRLFYYESQTAIKSINSLNLTTAAKAQVINLSALPATTTLSAIAVPLAPTVTTSGASSISFASATVGGNVTQTDVAVTEHGVVYSTNSATPPTTADSKFVISGTTSPFSGSLTGLGASTTYYMRAYATSTAGTGYGSVSNFTTSAAPIAINSINRVSSATINASSVQYTVIFASSVTGLSTSNFSLTTSGVSSASISGLSGSGTTYTVTVNAGTGDGTIGLNLANATGLTPGISNSLPFIGQVYTIDKTAPTVGISAPSPSTINTGSGSVTYSVTYTDANFNASTLASNNITINKTGNANGTAAISGTGNTRTVTISGITGSGSLGISIAAGTATDNAGNSALAAGPSTTFAVTLIPQHITFNALPSQTYGAGALASGATSDNSGVPVTLSSDNPSVATISGTNINIVGAGIANITASQAADASHSAASNVTQQLTVNKAPLTITASNQNKVYGAAVPTLTVSYSGFVNSENPSVITVAPAISTTATASSHVAGNPYSITASGAVAANYNISYVAGSLTVTPASLSITADSKTKVYGAALPSLTASYSGFVNGDFSASLTTQPTISTTATAASHVAGNPYSITASGAVDADYSISYVAGTLTIGAAPLTITADNKTMVYGSAVPPLTYSFTGLVNGDTNASLTTAPAISTTATSASHVAGSPYTITASGAAAADYTISYVAGSLTVTPAPLTVTADNQTKNYGDAIPTLTASYTGFVNGDTQASLTTPPTISTTATAASHVAGNPYTISASGAVDADYTISYVSGSLTINPAALNITADNQTMAYGSAVPTLTASFTGFVNGDTGASLTTPPTLSTTATSSSNANTYPVTASGASSADYTVSYTAGTLTIGQAPLTITADNQTSVKGQPLPTLTASFSGFVNGDTAASLTTPPALSTTATTSSAVGPYPIIASGATAANYNISYVAGTLTITASADATLAGLALSSGTLAPVFATGTMAYGVSVPYPIASVTVTPVTNEPNATLQVRVNGGSYATVNSGNASAALALSVGSNTIDVLATAQDGTTTDNYSITVTRAVPSTIATLNNLGVNAGTLNPVFAGGTTSYQDTVSNTTASIKLTPIATSSTATITVNGTPVPSGTTTASIPLAVSTNAINVVVTAQDGTTAKTYTLNVTRLSTNATLAGLTLSKGTLSPAFSGSTLNYSDTLSNSTTSITVKPTTANSGAKVTVNGTLVTSGMASASIPLSIGTNTIAVVVTAQDGTTNKTYTLKVTRLSNNASLASLSLSNGILSPAFAGTTLGYTASVNNATASITVTPTAVNSAATIKVNGVPVISGTTSANLPLNVGDNTITTVVTAQDGATNKTYTVTVNRVSNDAGLSGLAVNSGILGPVFGTGTTTYADTVSNATTAITVTPTTNNANATVTVNGATVTSGTASVNLPLNVGSNTITTQVTAQDGSTIQTYTIAVVRLSNDASLAALTVSSGALSPAFAGSTAVYQDTVSNATPVIMVTPTTSNANATIKVNGTIVTSGTISAGQPLNVGSNTITTQVTAQDGSTTQTYSIMVTRLSNDAGLSALTVSSGALSPAFAASTTAYQDTVSYVTASITVTATTSNANATIKINGASVTSGTASASLPLNVGDNTITAVVMAQDGTLKTYTVTVTRVAISAIATLDNLTISSGVLQPGFSPGTSDYADTVTNATASIKITPTAANLNATIKVNGATVASGAASASFPLGVGNNTLTTMVTAQDGTTTKTYTVNITRLSNNATLASLALSNGTLSPVFATATSSYTATVSYVTTAITITPTTGNANATVKINGTAVTSGTASASLPLVVGPNTITAIVTAQDGTLKTYTVTVTRLAISSIATLSNLTVSSGVLHPGFSSGTINYTDTVANATASVKVTPTAANSTATIKVNGVTVASGAASANIPLTVGNNTVTTVVTAQDGTTTKTYTIVVTRLSNNATLANLALSSGTISPAFATATTSYTALVSNATTSIKLTPTVVNPNATIKVNGATVVSGIASANIPLGVGSNIITTVVTAQDGATTKTYTVTVNRISNNAGLSALTITNGTLSPVFQSNTTAYLDTVNYAVASVMVTPTTSDINATVTVNGAPVASGTASASLPLIVGDNTITTVVTAQDGSTTKTYIITVTRQPPAAIATLNNLTISLGTLSPAFTATTTSYRDTVSNVTASINITPTASDVNATITVNGTIVTSGDVSMSIPLAVGANTINVVVTAQNGTITKTYILKVVRLSNNATLAGLTLSSGTLSPAFATATTGYTASVSNTTTSVTVTPTVVNSAATVKVNGAAVTSGSASGAIALSVGANTITTVVTAQNGVIKTYTITVTRASGGLNSLYLPGNTEQTPLVASLGQKVEANNILSPNGDGINDIWVVKNIAFYPDNTVTVYNKAGQVVFTKKGYANDWSGTYRGGLLTEGTYYYLVDLGNGKSVKGFITVVSR